MNEPNEKMKDSSTGQPPDGQLFASNLVYRGKKTRVIVNTNCVILEPESTPNFRTIIPLNQVISIRSCFCRKAKTKQLTCECISEKHESTSSAVSTSSGCSSGSQGSSKRSPSPPGNGLKLVRLYYAFPAGEFRWKVTFIGLHPPTDSDEDNLNIQEWVGNVSSLLEGFKRPKRLLMFINPFGGKRKAPQIYASKVSPLLSLAGIEVDCVVTQRANHARDMLQDIATPIKHYDGFVCVGGDGMFAELLNGLLVRTQFEAGINFSSFGAKPIIPSIPVGVIPGGSTDAVAYGTTGTNDPVTSTVHIIFGERVDIDVCAIHNNQPEERLIRYATSFLGYGYFGDVLSDSEKNRWMGPKRYDWAGLKKILGHRLYNGEIKLKVSTCDGSPKDTTVCQTDCPLCAKSALRAKYGQTLVAKQTENNEEKDSATISIKGRFLAINSAIMACRCGQTKKGISPAAHLGNGCTDLIVVSQCSRLNYLRYLLRTGFSAKSPFDLAFVDVYRVKEFEFTPVVSPGGSSNSYQLSNASVWNCDGEVIADPALRVKVHCQLLPVFGSGRENRDSVQSFIKCMPRKVHEVVDQKKIWMNPQAQNTPLQVAA